MIRSLFFATAIMVASVTSDNLAAADSAASAPNVLLIAIDDLNDWVGCLGGHPQAKTPNIDALAARGMLFTNAHCQAPICGPSRASLLSGQYPHSTGVYQQPDKKGLPADTERFRGHLLPEYFAGHGYQTLAVGKITHGYPHDIAFQKYGGKLGGSGPKPGGKTVRFQFSPDLSIPFTGTQTDWAPFPDIDEKMPDHKAADWAIRQLGEKHDRPFFLAVGFVRPHVPFYVPKKWFDQFPLDEIQIPEIPEDDLNDVPEIARRLHELPRYPQLEWLRENDNDQLRRCVQAYLACTTFVDHQVGRVLKALASSPAADNTVIVLFSDHGYHLGEKHRVSKHGLWEESTRVPLIVCRPGESSGAQCAKPVGLIDLYPTLLSMCGLPARDANEGQSLVPLLKDPDSDWRFATTTTYGRMNHSLRSERYRFIRYEDGAEELYDHDVDPHEWTNLAGDNDHQRTLHRFRKALPQFDAVYHASTTTGPVNAWFKESFVRHSVGADAEEMPPVFDGKSLDNWMLSDGKPIKSGWEVVDRTIHRKRGKQRAGHIVTRHEYGDFDLSFEWKIAKGGNSGLKYRVRKYGRRTLGCEFQILDDGRSAKKPGRGSTGSLYALFEPDPERQINPGEFNTSRIVVRGDDIQHWLNGRLIMSATVGSPKWDKRVASSKFAGTPDFGRNRFGRIMLTDHGSEVWYRNFKITRPSQK
ncbi:MAG: sulfatase-like hydrolase/transferase [Planctomycetes bacterium]|nr:sulfatase-like hydrolase/transferase [Planctomycetota bacterium]